METLTRLVSESLARHGFDRPVDFRRLQWSRWFRCESHHSLLTVPSKPGVFAIAEEVMDIPSPREYVGTAGSVAESREPKADVRRMLAVTQFFEDDDMAFVLDRMLSHENPMRARLASGHYFVRYVVIEDASQRRNVCNALNQWIVSSAEKATGIGPHFASSLELMPEANQAHMATSALAVPRSGASGTGNDIETSTQNDERRVNSAPTLNSAIATNIHCSSSFPSGF